MRHLGDALALCAWILLSPPPLTEPTSSDVLVDADRPLGAWERTRSFETAGACQAYRSDRIIAAQKEAETAAKPAPASLLRTLVSRRYSRCVADDDPELGRR